MTKIQVEWKKNLSIPEDLANRAKLHLSLLETLRQI